jgi:hypothetical protein
MKVSRVRRAPGFRAARRLGRGSRRALAGSILLAATLVPAAASAESIVWVSPGIKLSYAFGRGFNFGFELSVVSAPKYWDDIKRRPFGVGGVLNIDTTFKGLFKMRAGGQFNVPGIGIEAGPSWVVEDGRSYFGLGFTPFLGAAYIFPFYTGTVVFGAKRNVHELGTYLKVHINTEGHPGGGGGFFNDIDDD